MNPETRLNFRRRVAGQTIIVAMIILGLLLIIGFVFIGIINRNIKTSGRIDDRSVAHDLSEAGIRYAHSQLLRSEQGADWRGNPTLPVASGPFMTLDPDAFYLRPAGFLSDGTTRLRFMPGVSTPVDLGGPDGLGPYVRVMFEKGRALIRVRWAQSDANLFRSDPTGPLRNPGLARNYIIIESVGREGRINVNDPTTLSSRTPRRYQGYASDADFRTELRAFQEAEASSGSLQVNRAFASIGIIEHARFITNKFRSTRPVDLGIDRDMGARHRNDGPISPTLRTRVGGMLPLQTVAGGTGNSVPAGNFAGGGSIWINGDLKLFGQVEVNLNRALGDMIQVAGDISTDDPDSRLILNITERNGGGWITPAIPALTPTEFTTQLGSFITVGGILRDGSANLDAANNVRGIGRKAPPSALERDPQTNSTRYQRMGRDTGTQSGTSGSGEFGYGRSVYVANGNRRQMPLNVSAGAVVGGENSLVSEWLTPGGNPSTTGWRGWLYTPPGAYMELQSDGFLIQLDGTGPESHWKLPNGTETSQNLNRFRIGRGTDGRAHIVNMFTFADPTRIHTALGAADYDAGPVFDGVVYFEGNVRVRGVIPTDLQMTVVSNATVYIEGSITKGVVGNQYTATYGSGATPVGARLTRLSRSMLMLMAKDYVAVNPTQFFGTTRTQDPTPKEDTPVVGSFNPLVMRAGDPEGLHMQADFVLNPLGFSTSPVDPNNPNSWRPYPLDYVTPGNTAQRITTNLLVSHGMDNGAGSASFITLDVNPSLAAVAPFLPSVYLFPGTDTTGVVPITNTASEYIAGANIGTYGLGTDNFERYPQFESAVFPLVNPNTATPNGSPRETFTANSAFGNFELFNTGLNELHLRPTSLGGLSVNDYMLGRIAITPHDIRIEASVYAEEGSFFVIPGAWFNPNPNDNFQNWLAGGATNDDRNLRRYQDYGSYPAMPFYGEPLDVRIQIIGAVSENMPVPISVQSEWIRKWGWIPREQGSSGVSIPEAHALGTDLSVQNFVPNLTITYDPVLATGRQSGFANSSDVDDPNSPTIRADEYGRPLPPLPRLPVSPTLAYFGEVR